MTPTTQKLVLDGWHRLIPSRYSEAGTVLASLAETPEMLTELMLLDGATNDRIQGEQWGLIGVTPYELVYGIPHAHIVNAAFTHTSEQGSRFSDWTRGAWYAAAEMGTSIAEVTYHKGRRLSEMVAPGLPWNKPDREVSTFDDWQADFRAEFHILKPREAYADYLAAEPVPECYGESQRLARRLLQAQSNGVAYPSVRDGGGECLACFRPALVYSPRRGERLEIEFRANAAGYEHRVTRVPPGATLGEISASNQ